MSRTTDFHLHSTASDGTLSPSDLVAHARRHGVDCMALTDHDTTAGLREAASAAHALGMLFIPGIELSTTWERVNVHIVGLNIDARHERLQAGIALLEQRRRDRAEEIARRLAKKRVPGGLEGARQLANGAAVTRTHFARWLVTAGHASDTASAMKRFLIRGKAGHVPSNWVDIATAVDWIRAAGGVAVLAHPLRYPLQKSKLRCLVEEFVDAGGVGMEVVSGSQSLDRTQTLVELAAQYHLYASGGSDFHSPEQTWLAPGRYAPLPSGCAPITELLGPRSAENPLDRKGTPG